MPACFVFQSDVFMGSDMRKMLAKVKCFFNCFFVQGELSYRLSCQVVYSIF